MSDQIAHTPLTGPVEYDFGAATPEAWPRIYVSKDDHVAEKLRWVRSLTQICSYCGWEAKAGGDSWGALQAHVRGCLEHPVPKLKDALRDAREALDVARTGCACSVAERASGHHIDCFVPQIKEAIGTADAALAEVTSIDG